MRCARCLSSPRCLCATHRDCRAHKASTGVDKRLPQDYIVSANPAAASNGLLAQGREIQCRRCILGVPAYTTITSVTNRGAFNHHNPCKSDVYAYFERTMQRLHWVLNYPGRKLFPLVCGAGVPYRVDEHNFASFYALCTVPRPLLVHLAPLGRFKQLFYR